MSEQTVAPDEHDQAEDGPAKNHGDKLDDVVTDFVAPGAAGGAEMHDEQ
jgi:hypothetical protein